MIIDIEVPQYVNYFVITFFVMVINIDKNRIPRKENHKKPHT